MSTWSIPQREMIDIHMHLIPGVDDGAESMEMSLLMMLRAGDQGIRQIIATPHSEAFRYSKDGARIIFRRLQDAAAASGLETGLYLGCEIFCEPDRMEEIVTALDTGRYPTMNGTRYVLMEFSQWIMPENTVPCVKALVRAGYRPIIAHMERYHYLRGNMELVDSFLDLVSSIDWSSWSYSEEI